MFNPKYSISAKLLANIKHITTLIAELNSKQFPKVVVLSLEKEARELSAFASTSIEGNPLPLTEVKRILKNRPETLRDTEREVLNYNQALEELNLFTKAGGTALIAALILGTHKTVTSGLIENYRCGHFRKEPVFVNDPRTGKTIYWPPDQKEVIPLTKDLLDFINTNRPNIDPLILAGIFHKQFVVIHPFIDGNGRTARLFTKLLLAAMGLDTFNLFSFENYYNRNVAKYFEKVGVLGNYYDIKDKLDFTDWLEYFTGGIIDELLRVGKELQSVSATPETKIMAHHQEILDYIKDRGYITDKDYAAITKRAKATRNKDFNKLISLGLIEKEGKGKATYYKLRT